MQKARFDAARLFAMVHRAAADSFIAGYDAKYYYNFWRPIQAIPGAEYDGNKRTAADPFVTTPAYPARRLNPNIGHYEMGTLHAHVGMIDSALRAFARAIEVDPGASHAEVVSALWYNALYHEAIAEAENCRARPRAAGCSRIST